jgi:hypothetical protein
LQRVTLKEHIMTEFVPYRTDSNPEGQNGGNMPPERQFDQSYGEPVDTTDAVPEQRDASNHEVLPTTPDLGIEDEEQEKPHRKLTAAIIGAAAVTGVAVAAAAVFFIGGQKRGNDEHTSAQAPGGTEPVATSVVTPGGEAPASPTEVAPTTPSEHLGIGEFNVGSQEYHTVAEARDSVFTITDAEAPGEASGQSEFLNAVRLGMNINTSEEEIAARGGKDAAIKSTAGLINQGLLTNLDPSATSYLPGQQLESGNVADLIGSVNALAIETGSTVTSVGWEQDTGEGSTKLTGQKTGKVVVTMQKTDGSEVTLDLDSALKAKNNGQNWNYSGTFELPKSQ